MANDATPARSTPAPGAGQTQLRTVLVCDLAESTALVEKLGDRRAAELIRRHDRIARDLLQRHGGREIDKTDGFLALFERPIQAVGFALDYQRELRKLEAEPGRPLAARVGIHVGELQLWDNAADDIAHGAKPVEAEGLAKPVAARLMSLARPGQVLLSGIAQTLAQRAGDELDDGLGQRVRWLTHGRYRFKGVPQPMIVHEVGEPGVAPLKPPPGGGKATRELPWWRRPAALALELAAALVAVAIAASLFLRPQPAIAFAERDWVVVTDLRNLTTEPLFNDALDTAFRIGLERSRFVNVVPELQVRSALARMERADADALDRELALQVAVREGSRAVIEPTIAELGGRLRFSVQVIDPVSGRSVYQHAADGERQEEVLGLLDSVLMDLRSQLGESFTLLSETSEPLAKVTTDDLEALRAYSLSLDAMQRGDFEQALSLLRFAIEADPEFATAHARLGALYYSLGDMARGRASLATAEALSERLTRREQLYVRGQLGRFLLPAERLERWRLYAELYPDDATAQNNLGNILYMSYNDFAGAEAAFSHVVDSRHPMRNLSLHTRGYARLGQGAMDAAIADFSDSLKLAPAPIYYGLADALVAADRPEQAREFLDEAATQTPMLEAERVLRRITLEVDAGRFDAARREGQAALARFAELPGPSPRWRLDAALASVDLLDGRLDEGRARLEPLFARLREELREGTHPEAVESALWLAWLAARHGFDALARDTLAAVESAQPQLEAYPVRRQLAAAVHLLLAAGGDEAAAARDALAAMIDGKELWETRATLAQVLGPGPGDAHRDWLLARRGLAHAEWLDQGLGQAWRVGEWRRLSREAAAAEPDRAPVGDAGPR